MAETASLAEDAPRARPGPRPADRLGDTGGVISFLLAGAVLFASLVVGSSASMVVAGSNDLIGAILEGFLSLGLWALAGFLLSAGVVAAATALQRRRPFG